MKNTTPDPGKLWRFLPCCLWRQKRILIAPGNWECPYCKTIHMN